LLVLSTALSKWQPATGYSNNFFNREGREGRKGFAQLAAQSRSAIQ
jgi:hypothetical protein